MKLSALAIDYDGTIASNGRMEPEVRRAIGEARVRGIAVILATGRRLDDLRAAAGDLTCFDVVVAENGAVLDFPSRGRHVVLGASPPAHFIAALQQRGVAFTVGESVIEADGSAAHAVLDTCRALELPLMLAFNRSRLMVLPPAVAKSTGLRQALRALRISIHNTMAIGDAENDHDLLDVCEVGVAVEWGSAALRAVADEIVSGQDPGAMAAYLRSVTARPRLSTEQMGRRRLFLGHQPDGEAVRLAVRGRTILIAGEPGTGKSWLTGLICEQLILQGYSLCIIDPEGDYRSLGVLPDVIRLGGEDPPPSQRELTRVLRYPDASVVLDLSKMAQPQKADYVRSVLLMLKRLRRRTGLPHKIVLDEAHYFLNGPDQAALIDRELAGYILVTYRLSLIDPSLRAPCDMVALITREGDAGEIAALAAMSRPSLLPDPARALFTSLMANEAALLPGCDEARGSARRFSMAPRLTEHVRHRTKYVDVPVSETGGFAFTENGRVLARVRTLHEFVTELDRERRGVVQHASRHDFSRWVGDVFKDRQLAARLRLIEETAETPTDIARLVTQAIRARYQVGSESEEQTLERIGAGA